MAANDPVERVEIASKGGRRRAQNARIREERKDELLAYIAREVDQWPPLDFTQRAEIAALLLGGRDWEAIPA